MGGVLLMMDKSLSFLCCVFEASEETLNIDRASLTLWQEPVRQEHHWAIFGDFEDSVTKKYVGTNSC